MSWETYCSFQMKRSCAHSFATEHQDWARMEQIALCLLIVESRYPQSVIREDSHDILRLNGKFNIFVAMVIQSS